MKPTPGAVPPPTTPEQPAPSKNEDVRVELPDGTTMVVPPGWILHNGVPVPPNFLNPKQDPPEGYVPGDEAAKIVGSGFGKPALVENHEELEFAHALGANMRGTQFEGAGAGLSVPPPQGARQIEMLAVDARVALTDPSVLCNRCKYGQITVSRAAVMNYRPDGTAFENFHGRCLISKAAPWELEEVRPHKCSSFKERR